jgi:hypothetical protein
MKISPPDSGSTSFCQHLREPDFVDKDGMSSRMNSWYAAAVANEGSKYQVDLVPILLLDVAKERHWDAMAFRRKFDIDLSTMAFDCKVTIMSN